MWKPERIISGGQTGADRAGLDAAIELGIEYGGWVPRGRVAEDGEVPEKYALLKEHVFMSPRHRTAANIREANATILFIYGRDKLEPTLEDTNGSRTTYDIAHRLKKPLCVIDLQSLEIPEAAMLLHDWLVNCADFGNPITTLNVAGHRESKHPGIYEIVKEVILLALKNGEENNDAAGEEGVADGAAAQVESGSPPEEDRTSDE